MIYAAGVDVGSTQTKAVLMGSNYDIVATALVETGANVIKAAERAFEAALETANLTRDDVAYVVGTGYGRYKVTFGNAQITEISCHAKGAFLLFPKTRTVIDIGGQDAKGIRVGDDGEVRDFVMNDKCFVESDIMSYMAQGKKVEDILAGVHRAIAARVVALVRRVGIEPEVTMTGGVSRNIGMVRALEDVLGMPVNVSPMSHFMGAIGAAAFAVERAQSAEATKRLQEVV
jgi:activator of 2-hydroxyglutaryl-CoA dehydratase